jgi:hypothetical protein
VLTTSFLNSTGSVLSSTVIGNVTSAERGGVTGMLERSATGTLPMQTRFVEFALTNRVVTGRNDASADNLSFVLTPKPDLPFPIESIGPVPEGLRLDFTALARRIYVLERSEDLIAWTQLASTLTVTAGPLSLTDTNAPAERAFYRVSCRRP